MAADKMGMEGVLSDLQALKVLYGLLHRGHESENLDEASKVLLTTMLDDATQQALLRQQMLLVTLTSPAPGREPSIQPGRRQRGGDELRLSLYDSERPLAPNETGMKEVSSELRALKGLYGLLRRGHANENLDEASRALLMRMLDDATKQVLLRQAKMLTGTLSSPAPGRKLSIQPGRRPCGDDEPLPRPIALPSLSFYDRERSRRRKLQDSMRSRDGHLVHDHLLARVASNRSSRTTATLPRRAKPEESLAQLGSYRSSMSTRPQSGVVSCSAPRGDRGDEHGMPRGSDQSSLERSSRRRFVSREPSSWGRERLHGRATRRPLAGADGSSTRRVGGLDSGLSMSPWMTSPGSELAGRGVAATPSNRMGPTREPIGRCLRDAEEENLPRRRRKDGSVGSISMARSGRRPRRTLNRIDSSSTNYSSSSSGAASSSLCTRTTSPSMASVASSRRRRERQERREMRLRKLKNKLAMVFHRHDHHHHHHIARGRPGIQDDSPYGRDRGANHGRSPWKYLGGMFHRTSGHDAYKKTTTRAVQTKQRGGGARLVPWLFNAHKWGARRTQARAAMMRTSSRVQGKKMFWWQRLRRRRGIGEVATTSRPRRRFWR